MYTMKVKLIVCKGPQGEGAIVISRAEHHPEGDTEQRLEQDEGLSQAAPDKEDSREWSSGHSMCEGPEAEGLVFQKHSGGLRGW